MFMSCSLLGNACHSSTLLSLEPISEASGSNSPNLHHGYMCMYGCGERKGKQERVTARLSLEPCMLAKLGSACMHRA